MMNQTPRSQIIELNFCSLYFCITPRECHNSSVLYSHLNCSLQPLRVMLRVTVRAVSSLSLVYSHSENYATSYFHSLSLSLFLFSYLDVCHQKHPVHLRGNSEGMHCLSSTPPIQMLLTCPYSKPTSSTPRILLVGVHLLYNNDHNLLFQ